MEPQANQSGYKSGRTAPTLVVVCVLSGWSITAALGLACDGRPVPSAPDSTLTIGLGYGGTSQTPALNNFIDQLFAEPLLAIGWDGRPQPKLASEWNWDSSGRTLRMQLRPGVVFHDGTPLTAEIVAGELRNRARRGGFSRVKTVETEGDHQIVFRLSEPDAFLLADLSAGSIRTGKDRTLGTGPFLLKSREPEVALVSFPKYHLGPPSVPKIVIRTYDTPRASWAAMMRGEIDFLYEANRDAVGFVEAGSRIKTFSFPRPYYIPIVFNIKHPTLGRREVRQAINEAIDRSSIVTKALHGRGQPADGPIWPYHWAYNPGTRTYTYNPEAARLRLDAAGLPIVSHGSGQMPRRFQFRCLFWAEDAEFERIALVVQQQLFEIGIDVEMVPVTLREIGERHASGNFEAILVPMASSRSLDWVYWFWRSVPDGEPAIGRSGYTSADSALDRIRAARSDDETRIAVADLQRILYDDPPAAFLVRPQTARAVTESFVVPVEEKEKGRDILGTLWHWQHRGPSVWAAK